MPEFTFEDSSVEKAIERAEDELGLTRDDLEIEVLEEKEKGLLGVKWGKSCVIKVTTRINGANKGETETKRETNGAGLIRENLEKILSLSDLHGEVDIKETFDEILVDVVFGNDDESLFIGRRGKNLDAYQYLMNKIIDNKMGEDAKRVVVDCEGYQGRRKKTLQEMAKKAATEVKNSNRSYSFPPMRAADRRIIHMTIKEEGLSTESRGRGDEKKVFVFPPSSL